MVDRKQHFINKYNEWEHNRILPNYGSSDLRAQRYLFHLYRHGYITNDEGQGWLKSLIKHVEKLDADRQAALRAEVERIDREGYRDERG